MAILSKEQKAQLKLEREQLNAMRDAHQQPVPDPDTDRVRIPWSERVSPFPWGSVEWYAQEYNRWKDRAEQLQTDRDHLLHENVRLLRVIHALIDSDDAQHDGSVKGAKARKDAVQDRNGRWIEIANELWRRNPRLSVTEVAKKLKVTLSAKESPVTIAAAIKDVRPSKPEKPVKRRRKA